MALDRAKEIAARRRTVLGYGLGFKWTHDSGYGQTPKPCIKFLVRRKRDASEKEMLPKSISVTFRQKRWRFLTDVEIGANLQEHANSTCRVSYEAGGQFIDGYPGACGFFVRAAGGQDTYLVTAGHVLLRRDLTKEADDVLVTGISVGEVDVDRTYRNWEDGFYDVGIARVTKPCQQRSEPPHNTMAGCVPANDLVAAWLRQEHPAFTVYAPGTEFSCRFDSAWQSSLALDVDGAVRSYAPVLFLCTAEGERVFQAGDSGSPIMLGDTLVGFHFLGYGESSLKGFAVSADSIFGLLRNHLSSDVQLG